MGLKWSFESAFHPAAPLPKEQVWKLSSQRLDTWEEAWKEAGEWAYACFKNDLSVAVRLVQVDGGVSQTEK